MVLHLHRYRQNIKKIKTEKASGGGWGEVRGCCWIKMQYFHYKNFKPNAIFLGIIFFSPVGMGEEPVCFKPCSMGS